MAEQVTTEVKEETPETSPQGDNKETENPSTSSPSSEESAAKEEAKAEETVKLEADKAKLEEEIKGLEGTKKSITDDVVRARQDRKDAGDLQPFDEEALMEKLTPKIEETVQASIKPIQDENLSLKEQLEKSNDELIKVKQANLDGINARIASVSSPSTSANQPPQGEPEVELSDQDAKIAKEVGLKDPRYLKDVEVFGSS